MVPPSRLALTSTPSIAASSLEDTIPVRAVCARAPSTAAAVANRAAATPNQICFGRMGHLPTDPLLFGKYCAFSPGAEAGIPQSASSLCATVRAHRALASREPRARHRTIIEVRIPTYRNDG